MERPGLNIQVKPGGQTAGAAGAASARLTARGAADSRSGRRSSGQYDSNATVTSVAMFADCPRRYYLERYLGWTAQPPDGFGGHTQRR